MKMHVCMWCVCMHVCTCLCVSKCDLHICMNAYACVVALSQASVRVGDVFAEMIGFHYSKEQFVECNSLLEKMRDRGVQIKFYIDEQVR